MATPSIAILLAVPGLDLSAVGGTATRRIVVMVEHARTLDVGVEEATPSGPERACDGHNARGSRTMNLEDYHATRLTDTLNSATNDQTTPAAVKPPDTCPNPNPNPNQCPSVVQARPPLARLACPHGLPQ